MTGHYYCQRCSAPLRYDAQYNYWCCDACQIVVSYQTDGQNLSSAIYDMDRALGRELGQQSGQPTCNRCGRYIRWIPEYQRWWCDGCAAYL